MPTRRTLPELAFEIHFAADLASTDVLDRLQRSLATVCPEFCKSLSVFAHERDRAPIAIDVANAHSLLQAVMIKGAARGRVFEQLAAASPPTSHRRFGSVLLRGNARATFLSVSFDEHAPLHRAGEHWLFSNTVSARTSASRIGNVPRIEWTRELIASLADHPSVLWGAAYEASEFRERNLHEGSDGTWALGRDARRSLPGLFWLNVFGSPYRRLIDKLPLKGTASVGVQNIGSAALVSIYERPEQWASAEGRQSHRQALEEIGQQYFFNREVPAAETVAPPFTLP